MLVLLQATDLAKGLNGDDEKITVDALKEESKEEPNYKRVDVVHIFHTISSRQLPPERIGGIINMLMRPSSTVEEIENSLVCNLPFFLFLKRNLKFFYDNMLDNML